MNLSDLSPQERKQFFTWRHYHRKAGHVVTLEEFANRRYYKAFGETCDRPRKRKYGPPGGGTDDQANNHKRFCIRRGWHTWEEYQKAIAPWYAARTVKEKPREMALRILRRKGLAK